MESKKALDVSLRNAAGMSFSRRCGVYHWSGWVALTAAVWALLFGEYVLRVSFPPGFYLVEGFLALLGPFVALFIADSYAISNYHNTYREVQRLNLAERILDSAAIDDVRRELSRHLLLRGFRPPPSRDVAAQLFSAALWYRAVITPSGTPFFTRYGEWMADLLLGYLPLLLMGLVAAAYLETGARWQLGLVGLLASLALGMLALSLMRFAARRQAILDYFAAWRETRHR